MLGSVQGPPYSGGRLIAPIVNNSTCLAFQHHAMALYFRIMYGCKTPVYARGDHG